MALELYVVEKKVQRPCNLSIISIFFPLHNIDPNQDILLAFDSVLILPLSLLFLQIIIMGLLDTTACTQGPGGLDAEAQRKIEAWIRETPGIADDMRGFKQWFETTCPFQRSN